MFKNFFKTLFGKKSSDEDTRKIEDSCNYWADKDAVDYSPSFTAQDVLSSTETVNASDTTLSKETEEDLIAENQRLRMENEYLKKLNALVQERIKRENKKK